MKIISSIEDLRSLRRSLSGSLGFVPTMGALHEGHASLVRASLAENDYTVVSIFVNPTQFGPNEDFSTYPRTLTQDADLLASLGVDFLFAPPTQAIYPAGEAQISFLIRDLDKVLCGASRPGHMNGVVQVVSILFHLVQPDRAYFGKKDYQQALILQTLVRELHFPIHLIPCAIVREKDGLAMSSRNRNLTSDERQQALYLSQVIHEARLRRATWESVTALVDFARNEAQHYPLLRLDYVEVLHSMTLTPVIGLAREDHPHLFIAAYLGKTRLIDNAPLWEDD